MVIEVTANHLGYFSFKLCPAPSPAPSTDPTQECFDRQSLIIQVRSVSNVLLSIVISHAFKGDLTRRMRRPKGYLPRILWNLIEVSAVSPVSVANS